MPTLSIERQETAAQPVLFVRARIARHELAAAIGSGIGQSVVQAQKAGVALAGRPFARYPDVSAGLLAVECGMPVAAPVPGRAQWKPAPCTAGRWWWPCTRGTTSS
jgi:hypothetical protein